MRESLRELFAAMAEAAEAGVSYAEAGRFGAARESVRAVLSAGSKLHTRLAILAEMEEDAHFVAEVDRALDRQRRARNTPPAPVDGEVPLPLDEGVKRPRGRKGNPPA